MKFSRIMASAAVAFFALATFGNSAHAFIVTKISDAPASWAAAIGATPNSIATPGTWTAAPSTWVGNSSGLYRSTFDNQGLVGGPDNLIGNPDNSLYIGNSYFAVGPSNPNNPAIMSFSGVDQTSLSFLWGSVDSHNRLEFYNNNSLVAVVLNTDITPAPGNASGRGASYVTISSLVFDEIRFSSGNNAFEFSNLSSTPVPLPAAAWLLLSGLAGLGFVGRRKAK